MFGMKAPLAGGGPAASAPPPPAARAPEPAKPAAAPRAGTGPLATLVVRSGDLKGTRFPIRVPVVNVGRADYNDIVIADESVSTVHAKLQRREGVWVVVDLDSTNGTFVDGERIEGEAPLAPGALIRFGGIGIMFESTDDTVDPAKGSSTKMMQAVKLPMPPPKSGPA
jgi:pSer/pThr/pTyr-binding forkhead associated (FHA) protein